MSFESSMRRAQLRYDNQMPPDDDDHNCEEDGHVWKRIRSSNDGEVTLVRCKVCGEEDVI